MHALEIGADDYLVKPFSMKELVARVRRGGSAGRAGAGGASGRADRGRGAAGRPAERAGVRGWRERRADADGVPAPVCAGARAGPRGDARRAAAAGLGSPRHATATAPSTSSSASCARRSTARSAATPSSRPATASATSSSPRRSSSARQVEEYSEPRGMLAAPAGVCEETRSRCGQVAVEVEREHLEPRPERASGGPVVPIAGDVGNRRPVRLGADRDVQLHGVAAPSCRSGRPSLRDHTSRRLLRGHVLG